MDALTYVGHATVEIEMDGVRLLTDPVLRKRIVHLRRQVPLPPEPFGEDPDAILLSHQHFDHLDLPSLRGFGKDTRIISGPGSRPLLEKNGFGNVEELAVGESAEVGRGDGHRGSGRPRRAPAAVHRGGRSGRLPGRRFEAGLLRRRHRPLSRTWT